MTTRGFPAGFLFGAATAGHQIEGDNTNSDTWFAEQVSPTVFKERSGKACDCYELWREDVDLVHGLGLTAYRFSVEWARVEPEEGTFDDEALAHYEAIVDYCGELEHRAGGHVQPLHRTPLVRHARRLARRQGARAVRAVLRPVMEPSATGSPSPSR